MADEHHARRNAHPRLDVFAGGIAVVTGGASGIGFALAERAIAQGMHPVLADIEEAAIAAAEARLAPAARAAGVEVYGHRVDVSNAAEVDALATAVAERFPDNGVSLLCCNAGVGGGGSVVRAQDVDWDFVLGVNVKGVANCVRAFVPGMAAGDRAGAVVATSSQDGLCAAQGVYGVSKHACVALAEALYQELGGRLSVHVLCPNVVATNIVTSGRNRPERFGGPAEGRHEVGVGPDLIGSRCEVDERTVEIEEERPVPAGRGGIRRHRRERGCGAMRIVPRRAHPFRLVSVSRHVRGGAFAKYASRECSWARRPGNGASSRRGRPARIDRRRPRRPICRRDTSVPRTPCPRKWLRG